MSATEFVLYCCGVGILIMSSSLAVIAAKLVRPPVKPARGDDTMKHGKSVPVEFPSSEHDLAGRLAAFQASKYASPIVRRKLNPTAVWSTKTTTTSTKSPTPPKIPRVAPSPAKQNEKQDNVFSLPLKMKNDDNKE